MLDTPCVNRTDVDWHADHAHERRLAAELCQGCPIQIQCAEDAISRHETWGVWGGFDFEDITQHAKTRDRRWAEGATPRRKAECGTPAGRNKHYRAGEKPCDECTTAHNLHRHQRLKESA